MKKLTRKNFKFFLGFLILLNYFYIYYVEASHHVFSQYQSLEVDAVQVEHVHRTGFHFQPPRHWINGNSNFSFSNNNYLINFFDHCKHYFVSYLFYLNRKNYRK